MQTNNYINHFNSFFQNQEFNNNLAKAVELVKKAERIFFIGNGGSNAICSHMMEDYTKTGGFPSFAFSDAPLITCFANDYGYENAMTEWLKIHFKNETDLLIAVSSSGESKNILNAVAYANSVNKNVLTLSGFKPENTLSKAGKVNFVLPVENYGIVECYHQVILHIILDTIVEEKKSAK